MLTRVFLEAVRQGDVDRVDAALRADPSLARLRDEAGVSVVCLSLYHGHPATVARLVARRPDLDVFEASCVGDAARVARLLADDAALVDALSPDGFRPLGLACFFGRIEVFELLVAHGAGLAAPSENATRVCPLHSALAHRRRRECRGPRTAARPPRRRASARRRRRRGLSAGRRPALRHGTSVAISGSTLVVGAHHDVVGGKRTGSADVFVSPPGGWRDMTETAKVTASDAAFEDDFGSLAAIDGDTIVAGA